MATNCFSCKWHKLKDDRQLMKKNGVTAEEIRERCQSCVVAFEEACRKKSPTCLNCPWKDRNLPYEARQLHCKSCAKAFAESGEHECGKCIWNNRERPMPSDAVMLHCKSCLSGVCGKANNCLTCAWRNTPESVRSKHCAACSLKFSSNSKVVASTNELSNKGQIIESYDNHNANMTDDRDTVTQIAREFTEARASASKAGTVHPVFSVADRCGMSIEEFAQNAYELSKRFLYEMSELTDLQALLFLSTVRGEQKTDFAKNHGISDSAVNSLFKQLLTRSEVFKNFILLSRGTTEGTRGRKPNPNRVRPEPKSKNARKIVYCGISQQSFAF